MYRSSVVPTSTVKVSSIVFAVTDPQSEYPKPLSFYAVQSMSEHALVVVPVLSVAVTLIRVQPSI